MSRTQTLTSPPREGEPAGTCKHRQAAVVMLFWFESIILRLVMFRTGKGLSMFSVVVVAVAMVVVVVASLLTFDSPSPSPIP